MYISKKYCIIYNLKLFTVVFIAVISLIVISCNKNTQKDNTISDKDTVFQKESAQDVEQINTGLEGTWISTEDPKSQIRVKSNAWIELYEGKKPSILKFALGDSCLANANTKSNPIGKYITVFDPNGSRCFFIVNVNDTKLDLSYVGRGNTLSYKKKK